MAAMQRRCFLHTRKDWLSKPAREIKRRQNKLITEGRKINTLWVLTEDRVNDGLDRECDERIENENEKNVKEKKRMTRKRRKESKGRRITEGGEGESERWIKCG